MSMPDMLLSRLRTSRLSTFAAGRRVRRKRGGSAPAERFRANIIRQILLEVAPIDDVGDRPAWPALAIARSLPPVFGRGGRGPSQEPAVRSRGAGCAGR